MSDKPIPTTWKASRSPLMTALFTLIFVGLLVFIGLLLLEGMVRIVLPQVLPVDVPSLWRPAEWIGWEYRPGTRLIANTGDRDVEICIDEEGYRVRCDQSSKRECAKRILVIGDSYVAALSVPFPQTFFGRIEDELGVCTFVTGTGGYMVSQYITMTRKRLETAQEPYDLLLVAMYSGNDFTVTPEKVPEPKEVQYVPFHLVPSGLSLSALRDWFYPFNSWLESRSHAYVAARYAIRRFQDPAGVGIWGIPRCIRPSRLTENFISETARGFKLIAEAAKSHNVPVLVNVIPYRSQVLDPYGEGLLKSFPKLEGDISMDLVSEKFVPLLDATDGIDIVVDLQPYLREHAQENAWGNRDGHLSPLGHEHWFNAIEGPVRELLGDD